MTTSRARCLIAPAARRRAPARPGEAAQRLRGARASRSATPPPSLPSSRAGASPTMRARSSCDVPAQVVDQPVDVGRERRVAGDRDRRPLAGDERARRRAPGCARRCRRAGRRQPPTPSPSHSTRPAGVTRNANGPTPAAASASRRARSRTCAPACGAQPIERGRLGARSTWLTRSTSRSITERSASASGRFEHRPIVGTGAVAMARRRAAGRRLPDNRRRMSAPTDPAHRRDRLHRLAHLARARGGRLRASPASTTSRTARREVLDRLAALGADVSRFVEADVRDARRARRAVRARDDRRRRPLRGPEGGRRERRRAARLLRQQRRRPGRARRGDAAPRLPTHRLQLERDGLRRARDGCRSARTRALAATNPYGATKLIEREHAARRLRAPIRRGASRCCATSIRSARTRAD